jgi:hypothetical protein
MSLWKSPWQEWQEPLTCAHSGGACQQFRWNNRLFSCSVHLKKKYCSCWHHLAKGMSKNGGIAPFVYSWERTVVYIGKTSWLSLSRKDVIQPCHLTSSVGDNLVISFIAWQLTTAEELGQKHMLRRFLLSNKESSGRRQNWNIIAGGSNWEGCTLKSEKCNQYS